jgi:hypothetical protein
MINNYLIISLPCKNLTEVQEEGKENGLTEDEHEFYMPSASDMTGKSVMRT